MPYQETDVCLAIERYALDFIASVMATLTDTFSMTFLKHSSQLFYVCGVIHKLAMGGRTCTLRSIFYRSMTSYSGLLPSQAAVSKYVEELKASIKCTRRGS